MNDQYIALSSMVMDLKRAALGFAKGSDRVGKIFLEEAKKRKSEVNLCDVPNYIGTIIKSLNNRTNSDDLLMYSVLLQNYLNRNLGKFNISG